ncbi:hypothetical protein EVAR_11998_1 [Eumeta japonica]|uniref:Uncharacterized protein n=1 Tax=Eumeta variegata TaxID=151549 RepID=A0A4C1U5K3_EUMVA|nr:hypothetical protein EVAR_11998_1 [Eumeta japonica]
MISREECMNVRAFHAIGAGREARAERRGARAARSGNYSGITHGLRLVATQKRALGAARRAAWRAASMSSNWPTPAVTYCGVFKTRTKLLSVLQQFL